MTTASTAKIRIKSLCLTNEAAGKLPLQGVMNQHGVIEETAAHVVYMHVTPFGTLYEVVTPLKSVKFWPKDVVWFQADLSPAVEKAVESAEKSVVLESKGIRKAVHTLPRIPDRK